MNVEAEAARFRTDWIVGLMDELADPMDDPIRMTSSVRTNASGQADIRSDLRNNGSMMNFHARCRAFRDALFERQGMVAMWVAVSTPTVALAVGLGVDATEWIIANQQLQRAADAGANAGSVQFNISSGALQARQAANAAADVAEANGVVGASTRTWSGTSTTGTLVDNNITVIVGSPMGTADIASVAVAVQRSVAPTFSAVYSNTAKIVKASATADATAGTPGTTYQPPCVFTLGTASTTPIGLSMSGSGALTLTNCAIRINSGMQLAGGAVATVGTAYLTGAVTQPTTAALRATTTLANLGTVWADPYASNTTLSAAFAKLTQGTSFSAVALVGSGSTTISPGVYPSISTGNSATLTLQPGLYVVKGTVNLAGNSKVTGNNVSIINGSTFSIGNSATVTLTAPTSATATGGSVPAVVVATNVTATATTSAMMVFSGSVAPTLNGVVYAPKSNINIGAGVATGASGCFEIIANYVTISGAASMANGGCAAMGASIIGPTSTAAVAGGSKLLM